MSKKSRFRGPFEKQHGKFPEVLFKSASQHLYHFQWSLPSQLRWKKSLLLTRKILGLLVNTLAAIKFAKFFKSKFNFEHFEKKMTLTAFVFPKLQTLKT